MSNSKSMKPEKSYRPNVGLILFNRKGEVLVGERLGVPDSWQFPQGGIDEGEDPQSAALRELYEEVGINDAVLAHVHPDLLISELSFYLGQITY